MEQHWWGWTSSVPRPTGIPADFSRFDSQEVNHRYFEGQCLHHTNNGDMWRMVSISQKNGNDKFADSFTELELQHARLLSKLSSTLKPPITTYRSWKPHESNCGTYSAEEPIWALHYSWVNGKPSPSWYTGSSFHNFYNWDTRLRFCTSSVF